jgi:hypothetical protein
MVRDGWATSKVKVDFDIANLVLSERVWCPMTDEAVPDDEHVNEQTLVSCRVLEEECRNQFKTIRQLIEDERRRPRRVAVTRTGLINPTDLLSLDTKSDEFLLVVGGIVLRHCRQFQNPNYFNCLQAVSDACRSAVEGLTRTSTVLKKLDSHAATKLEYLIALLGRAAREPIAGYGPQQLLKSVSQLRERLDLYRVATNVVASGATKLKDKRGKKAKGRLRLPYALPTLELISAWESLTGKQVSSPKIERDVKGKKGKKSAEATQPSTEFVRLGLCMIDRDLTPRDSGKNAVTMIRRVLVLQKKTQAKMSGRSKSISDNESNQGTSDFDLSVVRNILKLDDVARPTRSK